MIIVGNEKLTEELAEHFANSMWNLYDIVVKTNRSAPESGIIYRATRSLVAQIGLFCVLSAYIPEGLTKDEFQLVVDGKAEDDQIKKVLRDPIVTVGLRNTSRPIDVEVVYQIVFDRGYRFIPKEMRPKDNFMNPPE